MTEIPQSRYRGTAEIEWLKEETDAGGSVWLCLPGRWFRGGRSGLQAAALSGGRPRGPFLGGARWAAALANLRRCMQALVAHATAGQWNAGVACSGGGTW